MLFEETIEKVKVESQDILRVIDRIKEAIVKNNKVSDNYYNLKNSVDQRNRKQLSDYMEQMRILNDGAEQGNLESEEDYLDRL
jgi:4-hydroxyphenylpyruvate dioxygenase-like putative hemolysin